MLPHLNIHDILYPLPRINGVWSILKWLCQDIFSTKHCHHTTSSPVCAVMVCVLFVWLTVFPNCMIVYARVWSYIRTHVRCWSFIWQPLSACRRVIWPVISSCDSHHNWFREQVGHTQGRVIWAVWLRSLTARIAMTQNLHWHHR